ncbi:MAG: S26 family signal peptidase [Phycisphaeraceae bacterium]
MAQHDTTKPTADASDPPRGDAGAAPPQPPALAEAPSAAKPAVREDSLKETFESIVIAFILAFVFRAYIVEAFIIPTGSMAPTLLGAHLDLRSPHSGYRYTTNAPSSGNVALRAMPHGGDVLDPMTVLPQRIARGTRTSTGDRILVQKYIYFLSEPRRWDVVVFKAPHSPEENFIKRLVGKPHEDLYLLDGNVYVRPRGKDWRIARKTDRPEVQRNVWQPIYHSAYVPLPSLTTPVGEAGFAVPWKPRNHENDWDLTGRDAYAYTGEQPSRLAFDFAAGPYQAFPAMYPYNQFMEASRVSPREQQHPIEDVRLAVTVTPDSDQPTGLSLETTGRWDAASEDAPFQLLRAVIDERGGARLEVLDRPDAEPRTLAEARVAPLRAGEPRRFELWFVDQHLILWHAGKKVCEAKLDVSLQTLLNRPPPEWLPTPAITISGPATLRAVQLDRDLHYRAKAPIGGGSEALGGLPRNRAGEVKDREPVRLGADEFYVLGDNSPASSDSRYMKGPHPWIAEEAFADPSRARAGIVPRKLMIGRAFFVYFPAPLKLSHDQRGVIPNFADMRFIH